MLRNYWEIEMHASAVVSEVTVRALFELFLIIWRAEDREAYQGFQPSLWYKVIADCPLEEATIIKLQLLKPFNQVLTVLNPIRDRHQRTIFIHNRDPLLTFIMPSLPFSASSSPSTSPSSSRSPSIVLHPASGVSARKSLHTSKEDATEAYRNRYAQYLACTFNMSIQAALVEADNILAPQRRSSSISEAESLREI